MIPQVGQYRAHIHTMVEKGLRDGWFLLGAMVILLVVGLKAEDLLPASLRETLLHIFR
jgi:hypothetical protein